MLYNKNNPQWKFNEDQYLKDEDYYNMVEEYDALTREMLRTDFRDINEKFYGVKETYDSEEDRERKRKKQLIGGICVAVGFAGLILALIFKQLLIFGYVMCGVFLFAGISLLVTGKGEVVESTSKSIFNRVMGFAMAFASVLIIVLMLFRTKMAEAEFFILLACTVFGIAGLALLVITVIKAMSGRIIYTEEANAVCKGYVRYVNRESGENHNRFTFIMTSPLFGYTYDGVSYEAVYDDFIAKKDSDVAFGQSVNIRIDPRHPENIQSSVTTNKGALGLMLFLGLGCLAAAIFMGVYVMNGSAKGMTVETQWNTPVDLVNNDPETVTETTLLQITDDMIEQAYADQLKGEQWYIETVTIKTTHTPADSDVVELYFSDDTFYRALTEDKTLTPGTELLVFYTVDEERKNDDLSYKYTFSFGRPGEFNYTGSHKAYAGSN